MTDPEQLGAALRERQSEPRVKRMWDRIDAARSPRAVPRASRRVAMWSAGGLLAAAAVALVLVMPRARPEPLTIEGTSEVAASPLAGALPAGDAVRLSDGSRIELGESARVDVLESSARNVALGLRGGRARFVVTPGGPREWHVECGAVTVEVVGTVFTIDRTGEHVTVVVERGSVLVRGDAVPDHVQRLEAGETLEVGAAPLAPASVPAEVEPVAAEPVATAAPEGEAAAPSRRRSADPVSELLASADAARRRGAHADAARLLEQLITEHRDDQRAALAAYSLARLRLDRIGEHAAAARDFARALELGLPDQLAEGAHAGRAIALARAGAPDARSASDEYLEAYPQGRYREEVARWRAGL